MSTTKLGIRAKVLIGLVTLTVVTLGSQLINNSLHRVTLDRHAWLAQVRQMETLGESLLDRASHYTRNAARDYESYARDVVLFRTELMGDIRRFENALAALGHGAAAAIAGEEARLPALRAAWPEFRRGLADKLGPNEDEPRLEWGAQYIAAEMPRLNTVLHDIGADIEHAVQRDRSRARVTAAVGIAFSVLISALALAWFHLRITGRILATAQGCRRVASGDFGHQLPAAGEDEIGQLVESFNSLSSRTQLVLSLLDHLQRRSDLGASFTSLARESAPYLPADWLGLILVTDPRGLAGTVAEVHAEAPALIGDRVSLLGLFEEREFDRASTTYIPDLRRHVVEHAESRLARELVRLELRSALLLPLNASPGWRAILVFANADLDAYRSDQVELMASLAPMLAHGFARNAGASGGGTVIPATILAPPPLAEPA